MSEFRLENDPAPPRRRGARACLSSVAADLEALAPRDRVAAVSVVIIRLARIPHAVRRWACRVAWLLASAAGGSGLLAVLHHLARP